MLTRVSRNPNGIDCEGQLARHRPREQLTTPMAIGGRRSGAHGADHLGAVLTELACVNIECLAPFIHAAEQPGFGGA